MAEEIEKILELAKSPTAEPAEESTVSKSARFGRACALLALSSVILFWLMIGLMWLTEKAGRDAEKPFVFLLVSECCLLSCLFVAAMIAAITALVGAKRHPRNRKIAIWAIALTSLAVAGFLVPIWIVLSQITIHFW
jgi:hypothetical protein